MRHAIIIVISEEVLVKFLANKASMEPLVPEDAKITGYHHNLAAATIELRIEHPDLNPVAPGQEPPVFHLKMPEKREKEALLV